MTNKEPKDKYYCANCGETITLNRENPFGGEYLCVPAIQSENKEPKDWEIKWSILFHEQGMDYEKMTDFIRNLLSETQKEAELDNTREEWIENKIKLTRKEGYSEGYEKGKNENLMAIDARVAKDFNKELKDESSELVKIIKEVGRKEVLNEVLDLIKKGWNGDEMK